MSPRPRALTRQNILDLLTGQVPAPRIADLINQRGLSFTPTNEDLDAIRAAGGTDELIETIQRVAASH
jgi:hypothetical protein